MIEISYPNSACCKTLACILNGPYKDTKINEVSFSFSTRF